MNKIEVGEIYVATAHKIDSNGKWEFLQTLNADGKDPITIWMPENHIPCGVDLNDRFKITAITRYTQKKRKIEKDGKTEWLPDVSVNCIVERVGDAFDTTDLPFTVGDNPFKDVSNASNPFAGANPFADDGELPL